MIDNSFLTCPKCHRMYETRMTKCEAPQCGFEAPTEVVNAEPPAAAQLTEDNLDQQAEADAVNNDSTPHG